MTSLSTNADLVLVNTSTRPGTLVLPPTSQIPGRTFTIKCATGSCSVSSLTISTSGTDLFEDGRNTQALQTAFGFMRLTAQTGKWYMTPTTQATMLTASTLKSQILYSQSVSTAAMTVSSLTLQPTNSAVAYYSNFLPTSIGGCLIWLDAKDPATLFSDAAGTTKATTGGTVQYWKDKSTSANNCTQATLANAPTLTTISNNLPALLMTASNTQLLSQANISLTNTSAKTLITVMYVPNTTVTVSVHFGGTTTLQSFMNGFETDKIYFPAMYNTDNYIAPVPANCIAIPTVIYSTYTGTQAIGYANFTNTATTSATLQTTATQLYIGKRQDGHVSAGGYVCEIIIYNKTLSAPEQQQIEGYLAWKWGIQAQLPTNHPSYPGFGTQLSTNFATQSFSLSTSLAYWGPYLLNSGFRVAPPQSFFTSFPLYNQVSQLNWNVDWQPYLQSLVAANSAATVSSVGMIGVSGGPGYNSGCLAPNGYIYFCSRPSYSSNILVFNPATETVVTTLGTGLTGHHTAILGPNGLIYMFPTDTNSTGILVVDPVAGTANTFITGITASRYYSGSLAPNGYIYFWTMGGSGTLYKLLPGPNTISTVTTFTGAYNTGSLGPNNCIYLTPESGTGNVLVINTTNDTIFTIGSGLGRYGCLALAPNGYMYGSPIDNLSSEPILIINTSNNSVSTYGTVGGYVQGFTLGANGKLYSAPGSGSYPPYAVTPNGTTPSITSLTTTSANVYGSILAPNGNIYGVSATSTNAIYAIRFSGLVKLPLLAYCLSPYTNKPSN